MRETPRIRPARERLAAAAPAPRVWLRDPTLDHRPIRVQTLADGHEAKLIETAEHRQIRGREGSVVHVEVFRPMASVRTSIIGRPRPSSGHRRAQLTTRSSAKSPHTPRSTTTRPQSLPSASSTAPWVGLQGEELPSSGCSRIMAAPIGPVYGTTPAGRSRSRRSGPVLIARRLTGRSSDSTGRWPTVGPMPAATSVSKSVETVSPTGSTTTTNTVPTPPAADVHPSPA